MSTTTYVGLVNASIQEAGTQLASFATGGSDFSSPPDPLMGRFKTWVARAWREIQERARDWEFLNRKGLYVLRPRLDMKLSSNPTWHGVGIPQGIGNALFTYTPADGSTTFSGAGVYGLESPSTLSVVQPRYWLDLATNGTPISTYYTPGSTATCATNDFGTFDAQILGWGSYLFHEIPDDYTINFRTENFAPLTTNSSWQDVGYVATPNLPHRIRNFGEVNQKRFYITGYKIADDNDDGTGIVQQNIPLTFIPWEQFQEKFDVLNSAPSAPRFVTEDNEGRYRFYPHPDKLYYLSYEYEAFPQILSAYNDTLTKLDERWVDMVMWLAVKYYGEFDEDPAIVQRANKYYMDMLQRFELEYREKFHFKPRRLY